MTKYLIRDSWEHKLYPGETLYVVSGAMSKYWQVSHKPQALRWGFLLAEADAQRICDHMNKNYAGRFSVEAVAMHCKQM